MKKFNLIFLLIFLNSVNELLGNETPKKNIDYTKWTDYMNKWTKVGVDAKDAGTKNTVAACITVIESLGAAIPYAGFIATFVSGILKTQITPEFVIYKKYFDEMNTKLDRINVKIDHLLKKIESVQTISNYKNQAEKALNLRSAYDRFTGNPTIVTKDDFVRECKVVSMRDFAHWLEREVNTETYLPLHKVMIEDYDLGNYIRWTQWITSSIIEASLLHSSCIGISYDNEAQIRLTLEGSNNENGDNREFTKIIEKIKAGLKRGENKLKENFFKNKAIHEVEAYMRDNQEMEHDQFSDRLFEFLSHKYHWRHWMVESYSGKTESYKNHFVISGSNSKFWKRTYNRCLFVGSTIDHGRDINAEIDECTRFRFNNNATVSLWAKSIGKRINNCLENIDGLAVVAHENGLRGKSSSLNGFFNAEVHSHPLVPTRKFSIMVIPAGPRTSKRPRLLGLHVSVDDNLIQSRARRDYKIVCYWGSWSFYRDGNGKFSVDDMDPNLCTHMIYGFTVLNQDNTIGIYDENVDINKGMFEKFNNLRKVNPNLKTMIAIGGWNEGSDKYSAMVSNVNSRRVFVQSVVEFLNKHKFNGLDMDWEYPGKSATSDQHRQPGNPMDKENYIHLLRELHSALKPQGYLLSAAVSAGKSTIDTAYNVPEMNSYLDFINLMTYDFHGGWEQRTAHNAPLYPRPGDNEQDRSFTVKYAVDYWLKLGVDAGKMVLGMPLYGRTFTLASSNDYGMGANAVGPGGSAGPLTKSPGFLAYHEICQYVKGGVCRVFRDDIQKVPWAVCENQWIGFDDKESLKEKVNLIKSKGLGGGMVWSIGSDDFKGLCGSGRFPLLMTIKDELKSGGFFASPRKVDESIENILWLNPLNAKINQDANRQEHNQVETGTASKCHHIDYNKCTENVHCCSNYCSKEPHWKHGVCKPGKTSNQEGKRQEINQVQSERVLKCHGIDYNKCTKNVHCCSNYCFKEPHWKHGVCKPAINCHDVDYNLCEYDRDCCSNYCFKEPHWKHGVCKNK